MHNDRKRRSDIVNNDKGRTIRKLMRGGEGGDVQKKIVAQGNEKKFNARQLTLKKYSYYGQKRFIQGI